MGTKQLRLPNVTQLRERISEFQGKDITIVLHDGNVFLGKLNSITESDITVLNMRRKKISLSLSKINEFYFDTKA